VEHEGTIYTVDVPHDVSPEQVLKTEVCLRDYSTKNTRYGLWHNDPSDRVESAALISLIMIFMIGGVIAAQTNHAVDCPTVSGTMSKAMINFKLCPPVASTTPFGSSIQVWCYIALSLPFLLASFYLYRGDMKPEDQKEVGTVSVSGGAAGRGQSVDFEAPTTRNPLAGQMDNGKTGGGFAAADQAAVEPDGGAVFEED